jgi:hypothetical protein
MSHTHGPWYCHMLLSVACENDGEYGDATCITNTTEEDYMATGNSGDWVAFVPHDRCHAANARLIAACPDMLAALVAMREAFTSDGTDAQHNACRMADAAIQKAGGGDG